MVWEPSNSEVIDRLAIVEQGGRIALRSVSRRDGAESCRHHGRGDFHCPGKQTLVRLLPLESAKSRLEWREVYPI